MDEWQKHITAADGYLDLGLFDEAALELENIPPEHRTHPFVFGMRVTIYTAAKKWDALTVVAGHLTKIQPQDLQWWISYAYDVTP